jgi:hypothetical protein
VVVVVVAAESFIKNGVIHAQPLLEEMRSYQRTVNVYFAGINYLLRQPIVYVAFYVLLYSFDLLYRSELRTILGRCH